MPSEIDLRLWLADLILGVHALYIFFVVGGQLLILVGWGLGWSWTRHRMFRRLHLAAIGLVIVEAWLGLACPLTVAENALRLSVDQTAYENSFLRHWLGRLIFYDAPEWLFTALYTGFGLIVLTAWRFHPPRRKL